MKTKLFFVSLFLTTVNLGATEKEVFYLNDLNSLARVRLHKSRITQVFEGANPIHGDMVSQGVVSGFDDAEGPGIAVNLKPEFEGQLVLDRRNLVTIIDLVAATSPAVSGSATVRKTTDLIISIFQALIQRAEEDPRINLIGIEIRGVYGTDLQAKLRKDIAQHFSVGRPPCSDWFVHLAAVNGMCGLVLGGVIGLTYGEPLIGAGGLALAAAARVAWQEYKSRDKQKVLQLFLPITPEMRMQLQRFKAKPGNEISRSCEAWTRLQNPIDI